MILHVMTQSATAATMCADSCRDAVRPCLGEGLIDVHWKASDEESFTRRRCPFRHGDQLLADPTKFAQLESTKFGSNGRVIWCIFRFNSVCVSCRNNVTITLLKTLSFNVALGILASPYPIEGPFRQSAVRNWNLGQQQHSKFLDGLLRASRSIKIHEVT